MSRHTPTPSHAAARAFDAALDACACAFSACLQHDAGARNTGAQQVAPDARVEFADGTWDCHCAVAPAHDPAAPDAPADAAAAFDLRISATLVAGIANGCGISACFAFDTWSPDNYVLLPGAAYNGNRFAARPLPYPPILQPADVGVDVPTIITDVPRLNDAAGPSRIQQLTRDVATPALAVYVPALAVAVFFFTDVRTRAGDSGIELAEADDRRRASVRISAPGVRAGTRHGHPHSDDRGATGAVGESLTLRVRVQVAPCSSIVALFAHFFALRGGTPPALPTQCELPFSAAWALLEHKYNRDNWDEATALYTTDCTPASAHFYQTGWCGGGLATLPLLACGSALSRARALRNLSAIFAHSAAPAGGFFGKCRRDGQWEADHAHNQNHRHARRWHLVRRDADMLYYLQKQVHIINADPALRALVADMAGWHAVLRRGADAFVRRWDTQHQGGHFIDQVTGVILVGGSASAGLAPAGLILAWQHYGTACYRRVAEALARYFYEHFIARGYTTGGPGDACQCPDSESAGALLESFVVLFEVTGAPEWLAMARDAAHHCASWVASYDYEFPATSLFGRRGMRSTGAVFANVQNKHGAPGLCTHSGVSLFKLFRATGDARYLALLRDIAHCIPQCVARDDRPLSDPSGRAMPSGWINERFNTSDWDNNIGGIFYGSCWCEIACMLTCAEVPGVYVQSDTGLLCILDHVTGHVRKDADATLLTLTNPTRFAATVAVFIERSDEVQRPLGLDTLRGVRRISLPAGATTHINLAGP